MQDRFRFFNAMVALVACLGAAHEKVYKQNLCKVEIVRRRLLRFIVGLPGDVHWTLPWHEILILHLWNERLLTARHGMSTWSAVCFGQYWKCANCVPNLQRERWVVRALNWLSENARRIGRPAYTWGSVTQQFCKYNQLENWRRRAQHIFYIFLLDESI